MNELVALHAERAARCEALAAEYEAARARYDSGCAESRRAFVDAAVQCDEIAVRWVSNGATNAHFQLEGILDWISVSIANARCNAGEQRVFRGPPGAMRWDAELSYIRATIDTPAAFVGDDGTTLADYIVPRGLN